MEQAFQAAVEIGIPIVNCGPGGKTDDEATLQQSIDSLGKLARLAEQLRRDALRQGARGRGDLQHADDAAS